jgi:DNA-directed RNA polymerase subunit RPC12/RpoP
MQQPEVPLHQCKMMRMPHLIVPIFIFVMFAALLGVQILRRRGRDGFHWLVLLGIGIGMAMVSPFLPQEAGGLFGVLGLCVCLICLVGLRIPARQRTTCYVCGYDLHATVETKALVCPECGTPLMEKEGYCLACGEDIRQAIAGGSIICPHCHAPVDERYLQVK